MAGPSDVKCHQFRNISVAAPLVRRQMAYEDGRYATLTQRGPTLLSQRLAHVPYNARKAKGGALGESELYRELGQLTKDKSKWEESIPYVASLLSHESVKIRAKALWLLGEMGRAHPESVRDAIPAIAAFMGSPEPLLRERAANALGRIGRADYQAIEPYWEDLFRLAEDNEAKVRLAFVWASENIATNTPDVYAEHLPVFEKLLHDGDDKVRMEAPEMFRVLGKSRPELVLPYLGQLQSMAEADENRVVRIHCQGAIKATGHALEVRLKPYQ